MLSTQCPEYSKWPLRFRISTTERWNYANGRINSLSIYLSVCLSMALQPFVGPSSLFSFIIFFTQMIGLLGRAISPSQGRYVHMRTTQTQNKRADIHASCGIRPHDPSVRAGEDSSCLRPRGHCDRLPFFVSQISMQNANPMSNKKRL
jgi:hypothetical protein